VIKPLRDLEEEWDNVADAIEQDLDSRVLQAVQQGHCTRESIITATALLTD
jgi:hypothetical protein